MAKLTITPEDLKRSMILDANWYPVRITEVVEEKNKKGDAMNIVIDMIVESSGNEEKDKFEGCELRRYFSEKAPGMAQGYIIACGGSIDPELGGEFEFDNTVGRQIEAYVKPRTYESRLVNDVADFRAPQEAA